MAKGKGGGERKGKRKPRERKKKKKHEYYTIEGDKIASKRRSCPKCGAGVFLAQHKDRENCGKCGYTQWKGAEPAAKEAEPQPTEPGRQEEKQETQKEEPKPEGKKEAEAKAGETPPKKDHHAEGAAAKQSMSHSTPGNHGLPQGESQAGAIEDPAHRNREQAER